MWKKIILVLVFCIVFTFTSKVFASLDDWIIRQITDNSFEDTSPHINGRNIVWQGNDWEIFYYNSDSNTTTQLTDNGEYESVEYSPTRKSFWQ